MPITITKLKMWKDPKYTHRCAEVPPAGSWKLPAPDYTSLTNLRPRKNSTISAIELPISFCQVFSMSYLYMEFQDNGNNSVKIFGWIDSVEQTASSEEAVIIRWTPDWWRTYAGVVTWGAGTIVKCNDGSYKRPYPTQPRRWKISKKIALNGYTNDVPNGYWFAVCYTYTSGGSTYIGHRCWNIDTYTTGGQTYIAITLAQILNGELEEAMGLSPSQIIGVYIVPIQPHAGALTHNATYWWWEGSAGSSIATYNLTGNEFICDDMNKTVVVDPYGSIIGELPWGCTVSKISMRTDLGTNNLKTVLAFDDSTDSTAGLEAGPLGRVITVSPLTLPVTSNALSDYVYSGQREYDLRNAEIARAENRFKGLLGASEGALSGGIIGGTKGATGAGIGAIAGFGLSVVTSELTASTETMKDDALQRATDKLYANQTPTLLIPGGGNAFEEMYGQWYLVQLTADDVSAGEYTNDVSINGYDVDIPSSSVSTFIATGGPLQINNLTITGSIPAPPKLYIKNKLESGVRIVENNPSGVAP